MRWLNSYLPFVLSLSASVVKGHNSSYSNNTYDFIVVGSGPGGAPVAAQLAQNGYSVLLMDAGDDQRQNTNTSVAIALADVAAEDETLRWDFFVRYHNDNEIENSNRYATWQTSEGGYWVGDGNDAPEGAERLGIYYPRSGTLGGCSAHNAGAAMIPQDSYWDYIAEITGDNTWNPSAMRVYFTQFENSTYLEPGAEGHGFDGWLQTSTTDPERALGNNTERIEIMRHIAEAVGHDPDELFDRMQTDVNSPDPNRDSQQGVFNFPFHNSPKGNRTNANTLLERALSVTDSLTIQLESLVTKVLFNDTEGMPRAVGVEYLQGKSLYRADPRSSSVETPRAQHAYARNAVVLSGGVFNTPQILKLSGIGPSNELKEHGIPVVVDLPGVGARLQDDPEISLAAYAATDLSGPPPSPDAPECTLGIADDPCVELWRMGEGPYAIPGATHGIHLQSSVAKNNERDLVLWNPPDVFRGFYPGYSQGPPQGAEADPPTTFSFAMVLAQSRNHKGGSVRLRSPDPRDVPEINFNFWAEGGEEDLQALADGINFTRRALSGVPGPIGPFEEFQPCRGEIGMENCNDSETKDFIRRQVYSHHASSTAAIGADGDEMAVLDGRFRVRGVNGLRVVDGSALPKVPSPFPIIGQFMASYKAAEVIIEDTRVGKI